MSLKNQPHAYQSWEVSDALWQLVDPLVPTRTRIEGKEYKRKPGAGRPPIPARRVFEAIFYILRTGIQWKALPRSFGSASAIHKHFQQWQEAGFFEALWKRGLVEYDALVGIDFEWQSIDGCKVESPLGQDAVGANPVDRGKKRVGASLARRRARRTAVTCGSRGEPA